MLTLEKSGHPSIQLFFCVLSASKEPIVREVYCSTVHQVLGHECCNELHILFKQVIAGTIQKLYGFEVDRKFLQVIVQFGNANQTTTIDH